MTSTETPTTPDERRQQRGWLESPRLIIVAFTAVFVLIEAIGAFISIPLQAILDAAAALFAVNYAIFAYRTKRTAGLVMAALFTSRLVTITLPVAGVSLTTRVALIAVVTIVVSYVATWVLGIDITAGRVDEGYPLRPALVSRSFTSAITILAGFPIGWLAYIALDPPTLIQTNLFGSAALPWAIAVFALVLGAFGEELLYRRLVAAMVQHTGSSQTPWISAALFGAAFLGTRNFGMVFLMVLTGAFFAWSCERTGSIKPVVAAHSIASILVFIVLP